MKAVARVLSPLVKRAFRAVGLEVQKLRGANTEEAVLGNLLRTLSPVAVLDVGANAGQYATAVRSVGYRGLIVSFEAIPAVHDRLARRASGDARWIVAPCAALGSSSGIAEINIAANTASSSLLPMGALHLAAAPQSEYIGKSSVRLARLDELCVPLLPATGNLFLKIDTQGYEMEVLKGGGVLLNRVSAMQLELSLVELYEGAPTLTQMVPFLEQLGFDLFAITPGFKDPNSGRLLQIEGFLVRRAVAREGA
jgi:FkbM family methyltransferase